MFTPKRKSGQIAWPEQFGVFLRAVVFFVGEKISFGKSGIRRSCQLCCKIRVKVGRVKPLVQIRVSKQIVSCLFWTGMV
jgi:hypothetical protein